MKTLIALGLQYTNQFFIGIYFNKKIFIIFFYFRFVDRFYLYFTQRKSNIKENCLQCLVLYI